MIIKYNQWLVVLWLDLRPRWSMTATMQENVLRWTSGHSPIIFWSSKVKKIEARSAQQKQILLVAQHCRLFPKVQRYSFLVAKMFFFHLSHLRFHFPGASARISPGGCGVWCSFAGPSGCAPRRWVGLDGTCWGLVKDFDVGVPHVYSLDE